MKKNYQHIYIRPVWWCAVAVAVVGFAGCADDWDAHYDGHSRPEQTLWQEIISRPELADFARLLKSRGYDKYLESDQRYTVWAPMGQLDTMLVTGEDMSAEEVLVQVVENHVARGIIPASTVVNDTVVVLNGKPMPFVAVSGVPMFNGSALQKYNIECSNGDLHILDAQAPYNHNLWSYLRQDSEISHIADYMYSFNKEVFSPELSTPGGVLNGQQVYVDSVFVSTNDLWVQIGYLNRENMNFTMLVPDNASWDETLDRFKGFYNYADEANADLTETYACRNILNTLVFDMARQEQMPDCWESTGGLTFYRPEENGGLFDGAVSIGCSNGELLKTSDLRLDPYQVAARPVVIEAEDYGDYLLDGRYQETDRPTRVAVAGTGVSSSAFMTFNSNSPSRGAEVTFAIPDVLSCAYDIGVVMVPTNLTRNGFSSTVTQKRSRLDFELEDDYSGESWSVEDVEYAGNKIDTVWVARGHEFPFCDYFPDRTTFEDSPIRLTITSAARRSESDYTMALYIDCIVLKPTINEDLSDEE